MTFYEIINTISPYKKQHGFAIKNPDKIPGYSMKEIFFHKLFFRKNHYSHLESINYKVIVVTNINLSDD